MQDKLKALKQYFGYDDFREGQEELIDGILSGRDVLGIMPTGAGKSICYQLPALLLDGVTVVISPLISLMKDQVMGLVQSGVPSAFINSTMSQNEINMTLNMAADGSYKLLYIAPERLEWFLRFSESLNIRMLTVDEAHCISQWGHDFRPSYSKISEFIASLQKRPVISAFTATATSKVRDDIIDLLNLNSPHVLITGFNRENLYFEVRKPKDKFAELEYFLEDKKDKSGIVYCSTRNAVEEVCERLKISGFAASRYHAGLSDSERHNNQEDFLYDRARVMVATNAFGMGIDKSNVSFVAHYNMPKDMESYYQEAGRAGRDGESADCVLFYSGQDVRTNLFLIENSESQTDSDVKERNRKRLSQMTMYCHTKECLRQYILDYFGEKHGRDCGACGNCRGEFEITDITVEAQKIMSCIFRTKERYGINVIIGILRGSKEKRIIDLGFDKLSTYNISEKSDKQLREIINFLILNNYLIKTDTEYPVLTLGAGANEVLRGQRKIEMKLSSETKAAAQKKREEPRQVNKNLLQKLKDLRLRIANENHVPAFVIFSDSSLVDMCMKAPSDNDEFLKVSGVGQVKLERYGEIFLSEINKFNENGETAEPLEEPQDKTVRDSQTLDWSLIETTDERVPVSVVADRINAAILPFGFKRLSAIKLNELLVSKGFLTTVSDENNQTHKEPTEKGLEAGIIAEKRLRNGREYLMNLLSREIQQILIDGAPELTITA